MLAMSVGCAMGIKPVAPDWDSKKDPDCTDGFALVGGDAIASSIAFGTGIAAHRSSMDSSAQVTTTALTLGAALAFSTALGAYRVIQCRSAESEWRAINHGEPVAIQPAVIEQVEPAFYCASSPTHHEASLCSHERSDCERARDVTLGVVPDLGACAQLETVVCFEDSAGNQRCAATLEACIAQRDAALSASPQVGGCAEVKAAPATSGPY